jgi:hypothetical protein
MFRQSTSKRLSEVGAADDSLTFADFAVRLTRAWPAEALRFVGPMSNLQKQIEALLQIAEQLGAANGSSRN